MVYEIANLLRRYRTSFLNISLIAFLAFVETGQEKTTFQFDKQTNLTKAGVQSDLDSQPHITTAKELENHQLEQSLRNQSVTFLSRSMSSLKLGKKI